MGSLCKISDCERPVNGRGLCGTHYRRWERHGDPNATPRFHRDPAVRFWSRVEVGHPAGCWWWTGKISATGYGKFPLGRRVLEGDRRDEYAHRFAYESLVGLIPPGLQLDHLCRNRACVNPDHLEIVTSAENSRRGVAARSAFCRRGHRLAGANLYIQPSTGRRVCQTCKRAAKERFAARRFPEAAIRELAAGLIQPVTDPWQGGDGR